MGEEVLTQQLKLKLAWGIPSEKQRSTSAIALLSDCDVERLSAWHVYLSVGSVILATEHSVLTSESHGVQTIRGPPAFN